MACVVPTPTGSRPGGSVLHQNGAMQLVQLGSGAEARIRNTDAQLAAVLVNGGTARRVPGTWSATSEWLAERLTPRFPGIAFAEVRYRVKSWHAYESCVEDTSSALDAVARPAIVIGFSMGGGMAVSVSGDARVGAVLGLAPWIPDELELSPLRGKRFDVVHGGWDRWFPGIPGVSPSHSRKRFGDAITEGAEGTYTVVARGLHGLALRSRRGGLLTLPRAEAWLPPVSAALSRFAAA